MAQTQTHRQQLDRTMRIGAHKTQVSTDQGVTRVRYHSTDVVKFDADEIVLNSGGWMTNTTKSRMNQTANEFRLGFTVSQKDFIWYVNLNGTTFPFHDGMILKRN